MFAAIGPGLLLAATGVGGGDLATGSFAGSILGTAVLWVVTTKWYFAHVSSKTPRFMT